MAKGTNPFSRVISSKKEEREQAVREAAREAAASDSTFTHQGPGTGLAGSSDPAQGSATLRRARESAAEAEAEPTPSAIEAALQAAKDSSARNQFDGIAAGSEPGAQDTPTAVTDNDAEDGGGDGFGLSDFGLGRKGQGIDVDDGVDAGVKTLSGNLFRDQFGEAGGSQDSAQPGSNAAVTSEGTGSGNAGAGDIGAGATEQFDDVGSGLVAGFGRRPGFEDRGSDALTDLQFASANAAIANASATETEPSVALGAVDTVDQAVEGVGIALGTVAGAIGISSAAGAAAGAAAAASGPIGLGVAAVGFGAFAATRKLDEATGAGDAFVDAAASIGEDSAAQTEQQAVAGRIIGEAKKDQRLEDERDKKIEEEAKKKAEEEAKKKAEEEAKKAEEEAKKKAEDDAKKAEADKEKGGGVSTTPDDETRRPPTPEEFALSQALKAELGQVRIPGDIDPVENDGTNSGPASVSNLNAAEALVFGGKESLVGNPVSPGGSAPSGGGVVPLGPDGTEILVEDGNPFTGGTRSEDPNDITFGPTTPLVGFSSDDEDEEEDDADDD